MLRVSQVLALAGLVDPQWFTSESAARGTAIHAACALDDAGDLDESSVHPDVAGPLAGWRRFRREMHPEILAIEEPLASPALGFCTGGIDRRVSMRGVETVLDIKSGAPSPAHAIQVAAYCLLFDRPLARGCVYVHDDGTYALRMFTDRRDFAIFKAALSIAQWRKEHGLK